MPRYMKNTPEDATVDVRETESVSPGDRRAVSQVVEELLVLAAEDQSALEASFLTIQSWLTRLDMNTAIMMVGDEVTLSGLCTRMTDHLMVVVVPLLCLMKGLVEEALCVPAVMFLLMKVVSQVSRVMWDMAMTYMMNHLLLVVE